MNRQSNPRNIDNRPAWIISQGNTDPGIRTTSYPHLDSRGMDSGDMCKLCFEPSWSPNAHVSSRCPILQSLPPERQDELIARQNRNYQDRVNHGTLRPPRSQHVKINLPPSVQHSKQHQVQSHQITRGLRPTPAIKNPPQHN